MLSTNSDDTCPLSSTHVTYFSSQHNMHMLLPTLPTYVTVILFPWFVRLVAFHCLTIRNCRDVLNIFYLILRKHFVALPWNRGTYPTTSLQTFPMFRVLCVLCLAFRVPRIPLKSYKIYYPYSFLVHIKLSVFINMYFIISFQTNIIIFKVIWHFYKKGHTLNLTSEH